MHEELLKQGEAGSLMRFGFEIGKQYAMLECRVADLEKTLNRDLNKTARELSADAAKTEKAVSENPVPQS